MKFLYLRTYIDNQLYSSSLIELKSHESTSILVGFYGRRFLTALLRIKLNISGDSSVLSCITEGGLLIT